MDAYRNGATGNTVLAKTRETKKSHRVPLQIEQQPRVSYDRSRGRRIMTERNEVVFDQETFAGKLHQLLKGNLGPNLAKLGKAMRKRGREAPRADFWDGKLYFDEEVEEERWQRWQEAERREWWGDGRVDWPAEE